MALSLVEILRGAAPADIAAALSELELSFTEYSDDPLRRGYAVEADVPQTLMFAIEAIPTLHGIFARYPRMGTISFLDLGPGYGAAAGLISNLYPAHFLGPKVEVECLDIHDHRQKFIELRYPRVRFRCGDIAGIPEGDAWDVVYCSNVIEHTENPRRYIDSVLAHTKGRAVFLAPYKEKQPLSLSHLSVIDDATFAGLRIESTKVFQSPAWPVIATGARQQIMVVLQGAA